jgi:hypothetical protein
MTIAPTSPIAGIIAEVCFEGLGVGIRRRVQRSAPAIGSVAGWFFTSARSSPAERDGASRGPGGGKRWVPLT